MKKLFTKRSTLSGSTFAVHTEHTPAFNTVHIIAAVIGVLGVVAVAVAIVIICNRRKKRKQQIIVQPPPMNERFGQFATDFDNHIEPPKPAVVEEPSPMMQQHQLNLKLHTTIPIPSSSSTNPPPPPYYP